jgi:CheY-specific phosphatase CheX
MDDLRARAAAVTANIFETMFFIFIEPQEDKDPNEGGARKIVEKGAEAPSVSYLKSIIQVQGEIAGQIKLFLPRDLARNMAENFLGLDEEVTDFQAMDMAGELLNMISGNLLSSGNKKGKYKLGMPVNDASDTRDLQKELSQEGVTLDFDVDGQRVKLHIQLH